MQASGLQSIRRQAACPIVILSTVQPAACSKAAELEAAACSQAAGLQAAEREHALGQ
jgi:hypothetical protein